ncbi:MAG TPA: hypothetical protein PKA10_16840 [Selenomonadales bacterium]|nr:hypothetical protein [Selenomonadales bacterium]
MRAIRQTFIDEFLKQADSAVREGTLVQFILDGYTNDREHFHDAFLQSRFILKVRNEDIQVILKKLCKSVYDQISNDLACINWLKYCINSYDQEIYRLIDESDVSAEDLLYYYEKLLVKYKREGKFFDDVPSHIAASQFEFYETAFGCLIDIINRFSIPFKDGVPKEKPGLKEIMALILQRESVNKKIDCICCRFYKINNKNKCWIMTHTCDYWTKFEIYRDLNIGYFYRNDTTLTDTINLFEISGLLTRECNNEIFRFDFARAESYYAELESFKTGQMLGFLYGDKNTEFEYKEYNYKIRELLELAKALIEFAQRKDKLNFKETHPPILRTITSRQLLRMIGLSPTSERNKLLALFCFDLEQNNGYQAGNKLLFRRNNLIYLLNSRIQAPTLIKVLDKILTNEVVVKYPEKKSRGIYFEECLEQFFRESGIPFWHIPRKVGKKIPEFDGMFLIDNILFIYEAKASIKPESLVESFNFLKDSLLKAQDQIRERIDILENDDERRQFIEKQTGLSFSGKTIQPLIICNHMFFSGYKELSVDENRHIPIIDFILLKRLITDRKAPLWELDKQTGRYKKKELEVLTGQDIQYYLLDQMMLTGDIRVQYQLTQYGVLFPICPPAVIDDSYGYNSDNC